MNRRTIRIALIAVVCLVALSVTAATIDSTRQAGGGGSGAGSNPGPGAGKEGPQQRGANGTNQQQQQQQQQQSGFEIPSPCIGFLQNPLVVVALLGGAALVLAGVYRRWNAPFAFALIAAFGPPGVLIYGLLTNCGSTTNTGSMGSMTNNTSAPNGSGGGGALRGAATGQNEVPIMFAILMVLVTLVALLFVMRGADSTPDETSPEEEAPPGEAPAVEAIGKAAGDAADRIDESGDVDNEVYRAWREMVAELDVGDPHSMTPGEFADAAVDAGMDRRDVDELTDLFEAVRYGGFDPTDDRERRALDALRRIEREYAEDDR